MTRRATNVIAFADRAQAIRKTQTELVLEQRAKELSFKEAVTGKKPSASELTDEELVATAQSIAESTRTFQNCLEFWKRLANKREKQFAAAEKKIARLEKQLVRARARFA